MKILKLLAVASAVVFFLAAGSCGGGEPEFFDELPDADLGMEYYDHLVENFEQYKNIYSYLIIEHLNELEHEDVVFAEDDEEGYLHLYEASYNYWLSEAPEKIEFAKEHAPRLYAMINRITHTNMELHFETMKSVIDSYVSEVYINSPEETAPKEETDEENDAENSGVDETETFGLSHYVSEDFYNLMPHERVASYLAENDIYVKRIDFDDIFSEFSQYVYPFRIEYGYKIQYHTAENEKMQTADVSAVYFLGLDENRNYIIEYISDPAVKKEIIKPDAPKIEDFMEN
ncbi:MAG: hypothetical protein FWH24_05930 [Oscillospiraceae bacterium]|nr:hypothetical protein [Oscillospiraceae bacterium]